MGELTDAQHNMTRKELLVLVSQLQRKVASIEGKQKGKKSDGKEFWIKHKLMDRKKIKEMWETLRPTDEYFDKWTDVEKAAAEVKRLVYFNPKGRDYPRVPILLDFHEWMHKYNLTTPDRLFVSDSTDAELEILQPKHMSTYIYNITSEERDLHLLSREASFTEDGFDLIIISQTFEHLYDPLLVTSNIFNMLKPGGYVFTSAPFVNVQHSTPVHYYHYTPMGLVMPFALAGFEVLELGQWGSFHYEAAILERGKEGFWPDYRALARRANTKMIKNSRDNPDQVWLLAQRPIDATL